MHTRGIKAHARDRFTHAGLMCAGGIDACLLDRREGAVSARVCGIAARVRDLCALAGPRCARGIVASLRPRREGAGST